MITLPRIFATGYQMTAVGIYFNQVRLAERLKYYPKDDIEEVLKTWIEHLKNISESFAISVLETNQFLKATGHKDPERPQMPTEYVAWVNRSHKWMLNILPQGKLPRALYLYGFCIGEIMTILTMVTCALDFQRKYAISFEQLLVQCQNALRNAQRRWGSIAKALGKVDEFQVFLREYLKADANVHALFIQDLNTLSVEEKIEHTTKIRNHIDFLENTMLKLQEGLPQGDLPVAPIGGNTTVTKTPDVEVPKDPQ